MANKLIDINGLRAFWNKIKAYTATSSRAGLMSAADKGKTDNIFLSESNVYGRINKYLSYIPGYIKNVEAYPVMRFDAGGEIMYYVKVTTTNPSTVVVYVNGSKTNVIEKPTIASNGVNMASFTITLPPNAAATPYKEMVIDTEEI